MQHTTGPKITSQSEGGRKSNKKTNRKKTSITKTLWFMEVNVDVRDGCLAVKSKAYRIPCLDWMSLMLHHLKKITNK